MEYELVNESIINSVTMRQVCEMYGIDINRAGFACCPFHNEHTPSMKIYPGNRGYFCFGCHKGGNVINFIMNFFDINYRQAIEKINVDFNLCLPIDKKPTLRERRKAERRRKEMQTEKDLAVRIHGQYLNATKELRRLKTIIAEYKPALPDEVPDPIFLSALQSISTQERIVEELGEEMDKHNVLNIIQQLQEKEKQKAYKEIEENLVRSLEGKDS